MDSASKPMLSLMDLIEVSGSQNKTKEKDMNLGKGFVRKWGLTGIGEI